MKSGQHHLTLLIVTITMLTISVNAISKNATNESKEIFDQIASQQENGYCEKLAENDVFDEKTKRLHRLAATSDILGFLSNANTITGDWIGNTSAFQIGRTVNGKFFEFASYAEVTSEARAIMEKDANGMDNEIENLGFRKNDLLNSIAESNPKLAEALRKIRQSSKAPMATRTKEEADKEALKLTFHPMACIIYQVVMDENSKAAEDFAKYTLTIRKKVAQKSLDDLRKSLDNLESY